MMFARCCSKDCLHTVGTVLVVADQGESVEEYVTRRTKEFNVETRERPFDINAWLQFAAFQVGRVEDILDDRYLDPVSW